MRRLLVLIVPARRPRAAPRAAAQERPALRAELLRCRTGDTAATRDARRSAPACPPRDGTRRMAMRFQLRERRARHGRLRAVRVPRLGGLGALRAARAGLRLHPPRGRLRPGAAYRALVVFRWYDADGDVAARGPPAHRAVRPAGRRLTPVGHASSGG